MTSAERTGTVPPGYCGVNAWVISPSTDAEIEFLSATFGARERPHSRVLNSDGTIGHVEVELAGSVLLMFDAQPDWPLCPAHLRIYVDDVEAAFRRALDNGSVAVTTPTELFFGDRVARVRDGQGHLWWIHQRIETVAPEEMGRRAQQQSALDAMAYVQGSLVSELRTFRPSG